MLPLRPVLWFLLATAPLAAQGEPIPILDRRDHVFDGVRQILYVTTPRGVVERYDAVTGFLLAPLQVGSSLFGCDLSPDGNSLLVCEGVTQAGLGIVRRVRLADGNVTTLTYPLLSGETHAYDLTIAANGRAFFSSNVDGSGWVALRELELATNAIRIRTDVPGSFGSMVRNRTRLVRGADRSALLVLEADISSGPLFTYDAAADAFSPSVLLDQFNDPAAAAVNRDGTLLALRRDFHIEVYDRQRAIVARLPLLPFGGVLFDPVRPRLYVADPPSGAVLGVDTRTWTIDGIWPTADLQDFREFGGGVMSMSPDGALLFVSTASGLRLQRIGRPAPRVDAVTPASIAFDAGAATVRIRGEHFALGPLTDVRFGGNAARNPRVLDDRSIECTVVPGEPGPVDVAVSNDRDTGVLRRGFAFSPALLLTGSPRPGETFDLRALLPPAQHTLLLFYGAPPRVRIPTPPFGGLLQLAQPLLLVVQPFVLPREVGYTIRVPNDLALAGVDLLLQALIGDALALQGAWSNSELLQIRGSAR